ncbi:MAG TPA: cobalamin-dependent protein, partial [Gammaproteobacteria bacterium]|nr:cobalamin-dependent protein [Gammaproteobacteria bacterium]
MTIKISFSDLTHTGQLVSANTFPLGMAMVAAYAKKILGDQIDMQLFKYPEDLSQYLEHHTPKIACFSLFAWNNHLSHEYARRLKDADPNTIIVFGGPNWPNDAEDQEKFLKKWYAADFCVEGEGEFAFVSLFNILKEHDFDAKKIKTNRIKLPNTTYLVDNELIKGPVLPRIVDLDEIPSVFEHGLSDKFFDKHLIPMIQTARGCPYSCTFCHEGSLYFNKTRRFSQDRVEWELNYISERVIVPDFIIVDLNFGLFKEDVETAEYMAKMQEKYDWPKFVTIATAKNHKQRVLEISKILHGSLPPGAAVQSTDPEVLKIIKRKNLPMEAVVEVAKTAETDGAASFSEIILCLPGDSKRAYFKSVRDVIDAGFTLVRTYQFMLLAGTEAGGVAARKEFEYDTRFRVKPMNFGIYTFRGEHFPSAEIEEICVGNKTMPYSDYRLCREMSLTIEIFNNNGIFYDFVQFLDRMGISRADFLMKIH